MIKKDYLKKIKKDILIDLKNLYLVMIMIGIGFAFMYYFYDTFCIFRMFTGFPCPGCGLTRAGVNVITLHFFRAWQYNATIFLWIPLILYALFTRYIWKKGKKYLMPFTTLVAVVTLLYFLYRIKMYYPGAEPINYHRNNIMMQFLLRLQ